VVFCSIADDPTVNFLYVWKEDLGVKRRIIFEWIIKKFVVRMDWIRVDQDSDYGVLL
jgi:hypothetical protein